MGVPCAVLDARRVWHRDRQPPQGAVFQGHGRLAGQDFAFQARVVPRDALDGAKAALDGAKAPLCTSRAVRRVHLIDGIVVMLHGKLPGIDAAAKTCKKQS